MPHANPEREPRKQRLLRLALLQIATLSIANGCASGRHQDDDPDAAVVEHTATSRFDSGRFVAEEAP
jgi:hypothetical protein